MANILTEEDTYFGSIAFRNKLITRQQLSEAVMILQTSGTEIRLGDALVRMGAITQEQIPMILGIQEGQREILNEQTPPTPSAPALPQDLQATFVNPPAQPVYEQTEAQPEYQQEVQPEYYQEGQPEYQQEYQQEYQPEYQQEYQQEAPATPASFRAFGAAAEETPAYEPPSFQAFAAPAAEETSAETYDAPPAIQAFGAPPATDSASPNAITAKPFGEDGPPQTLMDAFKAAQEAPPLTTFTPGQAAAESQYQETPPPAVEENIPALPPELPSEPESLAPPPPPPPAPPAPQPIQTKVKLPEDIANAQNLPGMDLPAPPLQVAAQAGVVVPTVLRNLHDYLAYARAAGASDLHISPEVRPFLRQFGRINQLELPPLPPAETQRLLFGALSNRQKLELLENRGLEFCLQPPDGSRYRATMIKQRCGWDGIFHIVRGDVPSCEELGLPDCMRRLTEYNQGMVLVTGPGNSGKTTTMAALIDAINHDRQDHVITLEEPIEYIHFADKCQITQREVGPHTKSFAAALRCALRQDPDVIMVGELRDLETLSMSISASETGHLVFGTLHTTSAAATVGRVVDAFPTGQQAQIRMIVSESLRGIICQQLLPAKTGGSVVLALEILFVNPAVSSLIRDNKPFQLPSIMQTSRKIGMCRMDDSLLELVNQDMIEGEEAYRRAENKSMFRAYAPEGFSGGF